MDFGLDVRRDERDNKWLNIRVIRTVQVTGVWVVTLRRVGRYPLTRAADATKLDATVLAKTIIDEMTCNLKWDVACD
jgi:hypothetical protein